ncbi:MAG: EVE domain-containing protein [Lentisphaerae bacterium]|nr:EVE domain-containing protein [Lentisphaerota bacterium]
MHFWLMKSEPAVFAFTDLKQRPTRTEPWSGVRNYQARNFMRAMTVGDLALFYHSSCPQPGVAGIMRVSRAAYPDPTAWDAASEAFDPKSTKARPLWDMVDVTWHADFQTLVPLEALRADPALANLLVLRRGNRLSVTPVTTTEFQRICTLGDATVATARAW